MARPLSIIPSRLNRPALKHAGANASFHMAAAPPLKHDAINAHLPEEVRQEQTCGAGPNYPDLSAHAQLLVAQIVGPGLPVRPVRFNGEFRG